MSGEPWAWTGVKATVAASAGRARVKSARESVIMALPLEGLGEVVSEGGLDLENVGAESVREILAITPLVLDSRHHPRHGVIEQIAQGILPPLERAGRLELAVVDVDHGVSDR